MTNEPMTKLRRDQFLKIKIRIRIKSMSRNGGRLRFPKQRSYRTLATEY